MKYRVTLLRQADQFIKSLERKIQKKIYYNLERLKAGNIDIKVFKKLEGYDLWEVRTRYIGSTYRLICFFDKFTGGLVVATHGFMKKTQKTPSNEIDLALQIMKQYYIINYPNK